MPSTTGRRSDISANEQKTGQGLYITLVHAHGLIRGNELELGRDADTGGQTKYVLELARALAAHPDIDRVDLLTRSVVDGRVSDDYSMPEETIGPNARIIRLPFGPRRYLRKEKLWPHLDSMADRALRHVRRVGRVPDIIHSHYADAGYVATRLAGLLGVPMIHTGHSLGREKLRRLQDNGVKPHLLEKQYSISQRIEAEEVAMDTASLVIASTRQEVEQQYSLYDNYHPKRMAVIPPGTDLSRFHPQRGWVSDAPIRYELNRFLREPGKPMLLAISRADERKNIHTLVKAYGENEKLRELANLVVVAGNRDDLTTLDRGARSVLTELLLAIDRYDLYGRVAYPKHHSADDVPDLYRLAARSRGLFINPALTEPFGLTLIEAAASGLPIVATEDGGPRDIVAHCRNGLLIDPLDSDAMGEALVDALSNRHRWKKWSDSGLKGAHRYYSWGSHVEAYLRELRKILGHKHKRRMLRPPVSRLPTVKRLVVVDVDDTLIGDDDGMRRLLDTLLPREDIGFGVATGRSIESTRRLLRRHGVPEPDLLITSVGGDVWYKGRTLDEQWHRHIAYRWDREALRSAMDEVPGFRRQPAADQHRFKLSYLVDLDKAPPLRELSRYLRNRDLHANLIYSHNAFLDLVPLRCSKGQALRYIGALWGIEPEQILVAGDSGNDMDALRGDIHGVVVGNHSREVEILRGEPRIYFAEQTHAWGVLEGIDYYDFLDLDKASPWDSEETDEEIADDRFAGSASA